MSATINHSAIYKHVMPDLPGCPKAYILREARNGWIEFCRRTQAWRYDMDGQVVQEGITDYDLDDKPTYAEVHRPLLVVVNGKILDPGDGYVLPSPTVLRLANEPTATTRPNAAGTQGLFVTVCLRPTLSSTKIDCRLFDDWYYAIMYYIQWRLMAMPRRDWSNPAGAALARMEWNKAISEARISVSMGGMNRLPQMRARVPFMRGSVRNVPTEATFDN